MKNIIISMLLCLFVFSCKKEKESTTTDNLSDSSIIQDQYGRQLILHGLNTSSSAKSEPLRNPWISESDVDREDKEFGFNVVRYLIFWDAIEPKKDTFDVAYLDRIEQRINWYTSRGMYVLLDMHQDVYSLLFGGDGAPEWACRTNGAAPLSLPGGTPWWLKNIDPQVVNSWVNFWSYTEHKDLQDHYILAWKKVAERFRNNPYVIGYDLMNEPWGGDLLKVFLNGTFEKEQLTAFYDRLIPALRQTDPDKYIFFEPTPAPVTFGAPSNLSIIKDSRPDKKLVYAPHCYPYDTHEGKGYTPTSKKQLKDWEVQRQKDVQKHGNIPLLTGEFGLSPNQDGFDTYLSAFMEMSDRNLWHWTYWSSDRGGWGPTNSDNTESAIMPSLVRAYPKATAGKIESYKFNLNEKYFELIFNNNPKISQPTEIFIPKRYFTNGYNLNVEGSTNYTQEYNDVKQVLSIKIKENSKIKIVITAK